MVAQSKRTSIFVASVCGIEDQREQRMSSFPPTLERLIHEDPPSSEAWSDFAREYTALLMHVARSTCRGRDEAMDAYAYLLEKLSDDSCRKLRAYSSDPRTKFTTWLVVVARRICIDHHRVKYGRVRNEESKAERERLGLRRRLEELSEGAEFADAIPDDNAETPAEALERAELSSELRTLRESLPPADRLLLAMRFDDGLSAAEISTILHFPSQFHVYRRINALLAELKTRLKERGYEHAAS
jgi:RNA polymerase sigma factor (sigma-70 family)